MSGLYKHQKNLLHVNKLEAFKEWVEKTQKGIWISLPPTAHPYECFRITRYNPSGDEGDCPFYQRDAARTKGGGDHISVPIDCVDLVKQFIAENPSRNNKKNKNKRRKDYFKRQGALAAQATLQSVVYGMLDGAEKPNDAQAKSST